ncbi:MAG: hypothetical protein WC876_07960 [Candidatus Thermoplasmatota archaeon]|jgi:hypothetical protein
MSEAPQPDKPAILKSSEFTVEEGLAYRAMRTGAIWMNKLFFSSLILLVVWLAVAAATGTTSCTASYEVQDGDNGTSDTPAAKCSVFLTPTAKYLGAMAVLTFLASLAFGALGLVVGKRILEVAKSSDELGAGPAKEGSDEGSSDDVPGRGS